MQRDEGLSYSVSYIPLDKVWICTLVTEDRKEVLHFQGIGLDRVQAMNDATNRLVAFDERYEQLSKQRASR